MNIYKILLSVFYLFDLTKINSQTYTNTCDTCINNKRFQKNIDCTTICQGQVTHLTECLEYTRCLYDYDLHKVHNICICQKVQCDYEYVCPHSEIIHYGDNNINGYTVYEVSLELKNPNSNIYAIYGNEENNMIIPAAYQLNEHLGANIGGINPLIIHYAPDSKYDSWLTIELTDGDPIGQVDAIGIDFDKWDDTHDLVVNNGAIFLDDPLSQLSDTKKYIIGHLTLKDSEDHRMIVNVNGRINVNNENEGIFRQTNIIFNFPKKEIISQ